MNNIYFHLIGGAAGDMLLSSLIGLGCPLAHLRKEFKKIKPDFDIRSFRKSVGHAQAAFLDYQGTLDTTYRGIVARIRASKLSPGVKKRSLKVYEELFTLEKQIHRVTSRDFKFHHLGEIDAIMEITGFFIALEYLKVHTVYVSGFPLDRPAPVTLRILKGRDIFPVNFNYETVTPTGAILLRGAEQTEMSFRASKEAYGFGNCAGHDYLVAYLIESARAADPSFENDRIIKIETNIDDMNPQVFESLFDALYQAGAKEVFVQNVLMKKTRPAFVLNVLCDAQRFPALRGIIFSQTTTFGIRYQTYQRDKLSATFIKKNTKFGPVTCRLAQPPFKKEMPEYEECAAIARKRKIPLMQVYKEII